MTKPKSKSHTIVSNILCSLRFPFIAADVLSCNAMIMEALIEGGWSKDQDEDTKDKSNEDLEDNENSLVASILKGNDE